MREKEEYGVGMPQSLNPSFIDLFQLWAKEEYTSLSRYIIEPAIREFVDIDQIRCRPCNEWYPIFINNINQTVRVGGREWRWADPDFSFDHFRPFIEAHLYNHGWLKGLLNERNASQSQSQPPTPHK